MSWRDTIRVHPAADLFPMMSDEELVALGEDIKGGLINPIAIQVNDDGVPLLIDGSNRLDAMERIGWRVQIKKGEGRGHRSRSWYLLVEDDDGSSCPEGYEAETADYQNTVHVISGDPAEYIMSVNVHRRHMTSEQKREVIAKMLKAHPEKSDRQIAEMVKASPTTIGTAGAKMEATGDVSKLDTRTDKRGREQPANKPPPAREPTDEQREIGKRNAKTLAFAVTGKVGAVTSPTPIAAPALQPAAVAVDPGEIAGPANALYVGLAGLDPILDRIAQLGVDAFWRHSGDGARVLQQVESSLEFLRPLAALAPSKTTAPDIDRRRETA